MSSPNSNEAMQLLFNKRRLARILKECGNPNAIPQIIQNLESVTGEVNEHYEDLIKAQREKEQRIAEAKNLINDALSKTGLTLEQIPGLGLQEPVAKPKASRHRKIKDPDACKYIYTEPETGVKHGWDGGAGRKPRWVSDAQNRGESMDQYLNPKLVQS